MKLISMPTLSPETTRKKGSEAVAAVTGAPKRCVASRSSADYVARGVRGDPRGRILQHSFEPVANPGFAEKLSKTQ